MGFVQLFSWRAATSGLDAEAGLGVGRDDRGRGAGVLQLEREGVARHGDHLPELVEAADLLGLAHDRADDLAEVLELDDPGEDLHRGGLVDHQLDGAQVAIGAHGEQRRVPTALVVRHEARDAPDLREVHDSLDLHVLPPLGGEVEDLGLLAAEREDLRRVAVVETREVHDLGRQFDGSAVVHGRHDAAVLVARARELPLGDDVLRGRDDLADHLLRDLALVVLVRDQRHGHDRVRAVLGGDERPDEDLVLELRILEVRLLGAVPDEDLLVVDVDGDREDDAGLEAGLRAESVLLHAYLSNRSWCIGLIPQAHSHPRHQNQSGQYYKLFRKGCQVLSLCPARRFLKFHGQ